MIKKKTTFVLGAGASWPYGLPLGKELIKDIVEIVRSRKLVFLHFGYKEDLINSFIADLDISNPQSIDIFLTEIEDYKDLGRFAIYLAINQKEIQKSLMEDQKKKGGIYELIYYKLTDECVDIRENDVAFVSFNYDRSLEQYLFTRLSGRRNKSVRRQTL